MKKKIVIGLTGGIASGKSAALEIFKRRGAKTLDCDVLARRIVQPGQPALQQIKKVFGSGVFRGKQLDRAAMAKIVFSKPAARKKLEKIIHPFVYRRLQKEIARHKKGILVIDIPLLFETGFGKLVDRTAVVWVPEKVQFERLMKRNGLSKDDARKRIRSQMPLSRKKKSADFVFDNSRPLPALRKQIDRWLSTLRTA